MHEPETFTFDELEAILNEQDYELVYANEQLLQIQGAPKRSWFAIIIFNSLALACLSVTGIFLLNSMFQQSAPWTFILSFGSLGLGLLIFPHLDYLHKRHFKLIIHFDRKTLLKARKIFRWKKTVIPFEKIDHFLLEKRTLDSHTSAFAEGHQDISIKNAVILKNRRNLEMIYLSSRNESIELFSRKFLQWLSDKTGIPFKEATIEN